ncbi:MAG: hypothetical protein H0V18_07795 [Pyrinomonadaceae bacterium]|nr:hypothetical protein [Pyrinomonadaceae bacterium]
MYYEIPLYSTGGNFHVHTDRGSLGQGWAMDTDLIHEAANGYPIEEISESSLPEPLLNGTYRDLRIFRMDGQDGPSYFGIADL